MQHVASGTNTVAMKLAQARLARQSQSYDRSQASPFDSMLDDNASAATDRARTPAPKSEAHANAAPRRDDASSASKPSDQARASADNDKAPKGKTAGGDKPDHAKSAGDTGKDGATGKTDKTDKTGKADKTDKTDKAERQMRPPTTKPPPLRRTPPTPWRQQAQQR